MTDGVNERDRETEGYTDETETQSEMRDTDFFSSSAQ